MKKRIEYLDLAKGICILLVVMMHYGINVNVPGVDVMRMPLYFALSGFFFKEYSGFKEFFLRKTNKLLVPFLFFTIVSFGLYYAVRYLAPGVDMGDAGIEVLFRGKEMFFNAAVWFLLGLFWVNLLFFTLHRLLRNEWARCAASLMCGIAGHLLFLNDMFLPFFIDSALTALPFFYMGHILRRTPVVGNNRFDKWNVPVALLLYLVVVLLPPSYLNLRINLIEPSLALAYFTSPLMVVALLLVCKTVVRLPVISYFGRYSIIILCTHMIVYHPLLYIFSKVFGLSGSLLQWSIFIAAMGLMFIIIPFCRKFLPWFTAQKDLIPLIAQAADNKS